MLPFENGETVVCGKVIPQNPPISKSRDFKDGIWRFLAGFVEIISTKSGICQIHLGGASPIFEWPVKNLKNS